MRGQHAAGMQRRAKIAHRPRQASAHPHPARSPPRSQRRGHQPHLACAQAQPRPEHKRRDAPVAQHLLQRRGVGHGCAASPRRGGPHSRSARAAGRPASPAPPPPAAPPAPPAAPPRRARRRPPAPARDHARTCARQASRAAPRVRPRPPPPRPADADSPRAIAQSRYPPPRSAPSARPLRPADAPAWRLSNVTVSAAGWSRYPPSLRIRPLSAQMPDRMSTATTGQPPSCAMSERTPDPRRKVAHEADAEDRIDHQRLCPRCSARSSASNPATGPVPGRPRGRASGVVGVAERKHLDPPAPLRRGDAR